MTIRTAGDYIRLPDGSLKCKPNSSSNLQTAKSREPQADKIPSKEISFFSLGNKVYEQVVIHGESSFIEFNCNSGDNRIIP